MFRFSAGISMLKTIGIGPALIWGRHLKCTLHDQKTDAWCATTTTTITASPILLEQTINSKLYVNDILLNFVRKL